MLQNIWSAYLEHWYLWTMIPMLPMTAVMFCIFTKKPNEVLTDDAIMGCSFLAFVLLFAWPLIWGVVILLLLKFMWVSFVRWCFSPSKKNADNIVKNQLRNIADIKQG